MLSTGECFGETSYVQGAKRTATIRAADTVTVLKVSSTLLEQVSASCQLRFNRVFLRALIGRLQNPIGRRMSSRTAAGRIAAPVRACVLVRPVLRAAGCVVRAERCGCGSAVRIRGCGGRGCCAAMVAAALAPSCGSGCCACWCAGAVRRRRERPRRPCQWRVCGGCDRNGACGCSPLACAARPVVPLGRRHAVADAVARADHAVAREGTGMRRRGDRGSPWLIAGVQRRLVRGGLLVMQLIVHRRQMMLVLGRQLLLRGRAWMPPLPPLKLTRFTVTLLTTVRL